MGTPLKIIISDTHIGAGLDEGGNALEDFISDVAFLQFIQDLVQESESAQRPVELIINGDFVEMLQVPATEEFDPLRRYRVADYEDSTEAGAVHKIRHVMLGHPAVFTALADFISLGPPIRSITITKGNHDPEQYWPAWQAAVRETIGAVDDLADLLTFEPVAVQRDGLYVEHGNQYLGSLDSFEDFETPLDPNDPTQVVHPLGSRFGVRAVNEIEWDRFWVDSIYPAPAMAWYLLRWDFIFAARALATFLAAGIDILGDKLPALGPSGTDAERLLADLEDEEQVAQWAQRYETDPEFRQQFEARVQDALETVEATEPLPPMATGEEPPTAEERAAKVVERSVRKLRSVAQQMAEETGAQVVSFGHTHVAEEVPLAGEAVYLNTGTWIWRGDFSQADEAMWRDLMENPQNYARERTLHYARIDYDQEGRPHAQLLVYTPGQGTAPGEEPPSHEEGCLPKWLRPGP